MTSRRVLKAAEAIREVVSMAILTELRDPRISDVTVTFVEVATDMRSAKVHVSIMGDEAKQNLGVKGLQNASGFLQQKIARRIDTRYTPRLRFVLDQGVKHSIEMSRILNEVLPDNRAADDPSGGAANSEPPAGDSLSGQPPGVSDEAPSDEAPSDEAPSDEAPSDETPSDTN